MSYRCIPKSVLEKFVAASDSTAALAVLIEHIGQSCYDMGRRDESMTTEREGVHPHWSFWPDYAQRVAAQLRDALPVGESLPVDDDSEYERGHRDGMAQMRGHMGAVDDEEANAVRGDGTSRLLVALYGEADIRRALGGSEARMLHDAVDEIAKLRAIAGLLEGRAIEAVAKLIGSELKGEGLDGFLHMAIRNPKGMEARAHSTKVLRNLQKRIRDGAWKRHLPEDGFDVPSGEAELQAELDADRQIVRDFLESDLEDDDLIRLRQHADAWPPAPEGDEG